MLNFKLIITPMGDKFITELYINGNLEKDCEAITDTRIEAVEIITKIRKEYKSILEDLGFGFHIEKEKINCCEERKEVLPGYFKKISKCKYLWFLSCRLHREFVSEDGVWRVCCDKCTTPHYIKEK